MAVLELRGQPREYARRSKKRQDRPVSQTVKAAQGMQDARELGDAALEQVAGGDGNKGAPSLFQSCATGTHIKVTP
jgi:hypothetical protein